MILKKYHSMTLGVKRHTDFLGKVLNFLRVYILALSDGKQRVGPYIRISDRFS